MITLATDFGTPYPAAMRGVIARRTDARVVDIDHDLPRQNVASAAFWCRFVCPEFPPAVHCAVVDPGVGTGREVLVGRVGDHTLVGPDNGLLRPLARALAADGPVHRTGIASTERADGGDGSDDIEWFHADPERPDSATFHGRDVFAPLAAEVHDAEVESLDRLTPAEAPVDCRLPLPDVSDGRATGTVLAVDGFGNAITNLPGDLLSGRDSEQVRVNGVSAAVAETFEGVAVGDRLVTVGSHGQVECDVNRGRGDEAFGLSVGDGLTLAFDA